MRVWSKFAVLCVTALLAAHTVSPVQAQVSPQLCGPLNPKPWDYRVERRFHALVEDAHFTPQVEALIRGQTGALPAPDIEYTLSVFPNHPRAILAATRLSERDQTKLRNQMPRPAECYYERGLRFRPDDTVVRLLYAQFLHKRDRKPEALHQVSEALRYAGGNPLTMRNAGLVYIEMKEYERALPLAQALVSEYSDQELKTALVSAGHWREPAAAAPAAAASAAQGAASQADRSADR